MFTITLSLLEKQKPEAIIGRTQFLLSKMDREPSDFKHMTTWGMLVYYWYEKRDAHNFELLPQWFRCHRDTAVFIHSLGTLRHSHLEVRGFQGSNPSGSSTFGMIWMPTVFSHNYTDTIESYCKVSTYGCYYRLEKVGKSHAHRASIAGQCLTIDR